MTAIEIEDLYAGQYREVTTVLYMYIQNPIGLLSFRVGLKVMFIQRKIKVTDHIYSLPGKM